jgi:hypothetical protein
LQYRRQLEKEKIEEKEAAEKMTNGVNKDEGGETSGQSIIVYVVLKLVSLCFLISFRLFSNLSLFAFLHNHS